MGAGPEPEPFACFPIGVARSATVKPPVRLDTRRLPFG